LVEDWHGVDQEERFKESSDRVDCRTAAENAEFGSAEVEP
jgi:hypothetical protein